MKNGVTSQNGTFTYSIGSCLIFEGWTDEMIDVFV